MRANAYPAIYKRIEDAGTIYLDEQNIAGMIERHGRTGQAWSFRGRYSTYRPNGKIIYKSLAQLSPESEEDFCNIMAACEHNKVSPPSSFSTIFQGIYKSPWPRQSVIAPFAWYRAGGWQVAARPGYHAGTIRQYDMNSAYRWAASCGLPDLSTAHPTRDAAHPFAIYLIRLKDTKRVPYWRMKGLIPWTSEERDYFNWMPKPDDIVAGVGFRHIVDLKPLLDSLPVRFPHCYKRIGRAFWGAWNSAEPVSMQTWGGGVGKPKVTALSSKTYNPIWTHYVTSRVKLVLSVWFDLALHIFVDSILTPLEIPTGDGVGDWKLVDEYKDVTIYGPGQWGDRRGLLKHAGMTEQQAQKLVRI